MTDDGWQMTDGGRRMTEDSGLVNPNKKIRDKLEKWLIGGQLKNEIKTHRSQITIHQSPVVGG